MRIFKFKKEVTNKLSNIESKINDLSNNTASKAKKYDELISFINEIKFDLKNVSLFVNDYGSVGVKIDYTLPSIKIGFDEEGKIIKNNRFVAINQLNLISLEDMKKISNKIEEAKTKNRS